MTLDDFFEPYMYAHRSNCRPEVIKIAYLISGVEDIIFTNKAMLYRGHVLLAACNKHLVRGRLYSDFMQDINQDETKLLLDALNDAKLQVLTQQLNEVITPLVGMLSSPQRRWQKVINTDTRKWDGANYLVH